MTSKGQASLLARVNFPLYTVECLSERHIMVAGGGGAAKTGIDNVIEIYEIINERGRCRAKRVTRFDTGSHAVMNGCVFFDGKNHAMAVGMENMCQLYQLKWKILSAEREGDMLPTKTAETVRSTNEDKTGLFKSISNKSSQVSERRDSGSTTVRKRHRTNSSSQDNEENTKNRKTQTGDKKDSNDNSICDIGFEVTKLGSAQTDFSKNEPFQKVVKVTPDGSVIITAGADGSIRTWKYPKMQLLYTIKAHSTEVDDIDVSPRGDKIISVSSDGHAYIWNTKNGGKNVELKWPSPQANEKYVAKACRFARVEGKSDKPVLFTAFVPAIRKKPPLPCYVGKWNCTDFTPAKIVNTGPDIISCLTVNDNGKFLAIGTLSGSIQIYIAFNLQKLKVLEGVHGIFVTGIEFLSSSEQTRMITGGKEASLVSISVDNHINICHIDEPPSISLMLFVFILIGCLILTFIFCDLIGL